MLTAKQQALLETQDRLIDLLVQCDEAIHTEDWAKSRALETEIDDAMARQKELRGLIS